MRGVTKCDRGRVGRNWSKIAWRTLWTAPKVSATRLYRYADEKYAFWNNYVMCFKYCVLKLLCAMRGLSFCDLKFAYRNFKDSKGSVISNELLKLKSFINMIPVSTAACGRGFSKLNIICSPSRTWLTVKHTSSLMFVSLSGPSVMLFEPLKYVKSWLLLNWRSAVNST